MPNRLSRGNPKTGSAVVTYSRTPGATCPGASDWCYEACYAKQAYRQYRSTEIQWDINAIRDDAPILPKPRKDGKPIDLRIHVSGDFDTPEYIYSWYFALKDRPDIRAWTYTRSWTVPELLPALRKLRSLTNVQLFASTDPTMASKPPRGWRVAFIEGDSRYQGVACLEQTGQKRDCASCGFCFRGQSKNVMFLKHLKGQLSHGNKVRKSA